MALRHRRLVEGGEEYYWEVASVVLGRGHTTARVYLPTILGMDGGLS